MCHIGRITDSNKGHGPALMQPQPTKGGSKMLYIIAVVYTVLSLIDYLIDKA